MYGVQMEISVPNNRPLICARDRNKYNTEKWVPLNNPAKKGFSNLNLSEMTMKKSVGKILIPVKF